MSDDQTGGGNGSDWAIALRTLAVAGTWEELRGDLDRAGILSRLTGEERQMLGDAWAAREAGAMDDAALARDLAWWAAGGRPDDHPLGFRAPRPPVLVAEADRRGWFVRRLPGGKALVNPPDSKPLTLTGLDAP